MVDIGNEELTPIRQVPARLPRRVTGRQVHVTTVYRWINHGVRGVKLEGRAENASILDACANKGSDLKRVMALEEGTKLGPCETLSRRVLASGARL